MSNPLEEFYNLPIRPDTFKNSYLTDPIIWYSILPHICLTKPRLENDDYFPNDYDPDPNLDWNNLLILTLAALTPDNIPDQVLLKDRQNHPITHVKLSTDDNLDVIPYQISEWFRSPKWTLRSDVNLNNPEQTPFLEKLFLNVIIDQIAEIEAHFQELEEQATLTYIPSGIEQDTPEYLKYSHSYKNKRGIFQEIITLLKNSSEWIPREHYLTHTDTINQTRLEISQIDREIRMHKTPTSPKGDQLIQGSIFFDIDTDPQNPSCIPLSSFLFDYEDMTIISDLGYTINQTNKDCSITFKGKKVDSTNLITLPDGGPDEVKYQLSGTFGEPKNGLQSIDIYFDANFNLVSY